MKNWDRLAILLLAGGLVLAAGCSKAPPQPPAANEGPKIGVSLADLDLRRAPVPDVKLTAAQEGNGPAPDLTDISFSTADTGFGVTTHGVISRTDDGGVTWREVYKLHGARFSQVQTVAGQVAFATGLTGCEPGPNCEGPAVLLRTADGGLTWTQVDLQLPEGLERWAFTRLAFQFLSAEVGFAWPDIHQNYAGNRITSPLVTRDGGKSWAPISLPEGYSLSRGLHFRSPEVGFITVSAQSGPDYRVLQTRDGGRTWKTLYKENEVALFAVHFVTEEDGYAAGGMNPRTERGPGQFVAATHDGGVTWEVVKKMEERGSPFSALNFISPTEGWAATGGCWSMGASGPCGGELLFTRDGGRSWNKTGTGVTGIRSVGKRAWSLRGGGATTLYLTDDGGATWQNLWRPDAVQVQRLQFLSPQVGFLATNLGFYKTTDGGTTWAPYPLGAPAASHPEAVRFLSEQTALLPDSFNLLRSDDGGKSWTEIQAALPRSAEGAFNTLAPDGKGGLWLGNRRTDCPAKTECPDLLLHSTDGGRTWESVPVPAGHINEIVMKDDQRGVLLTWGSQLLITADGGKTWSEQAGAKELSLYHASYAGGADLLWASGTAFLSLEETPSVLLHSADGGQTWTGWRGMEARQIQFVSPDEGWIVGWAPGIDNGGALLHTTDGGRTWTQIWPNLSR